jgi:aspartate/methionine/tyrosine aminotransferase
VRACVEAGDEVVVLTPYWPLSVGVVRSAGAVPVEVAFTPVLHAEGLEAALAAVRAAIGHRTRGLYFASPNNPCGAVYGRDSLAALVALAERHDLWVFADEVYADYAYDAPFVSAASLGEERVVTLAAPAVLEAIGKVATHSAFHPSHHAQGLAFASLGSDAWVEEARVDYIEARAAVVDALAAARVPHLPAQGGSYVFADFREAAVRAGGANALFARFVDSGVLVCPGAACGEGFDAFARLCFTGLPVGELRAAMRTLVAALEPSSNS